MSKLNLLVIEGDRKFEKMNVKTLWVNEQAFNVIELFMYFLPKTEFDGCSKLNICFYEAPEYVKGKQYVYDAYEHVSCYYVDQPFIQQSRQLQVEEKDEFYLRVIEKTLTDIASQCNDQEELEQLVKKTATKVRACQFKQTIKVSKLSKVSPDKLYKAVTYRQLTTDGERDYVEITDKSKNVMRYNLMNRYDFLPLRYRFQKCIWNNDEFQILDRLGHVSVTINPSSQTIDSIYWSSSSKDMWPKVEKR